MPQYRFAVQASEDPNVIDQETEKTSRVKKFGRLRRHKMSIDQAPPFRFSSQYYEIRRDTFASLFEFLGSEEHDGRNRSELVTLITSHANLSLVSKSFSISIDELQILTDDILNDLVGFGPLEELLRQDEITDIMVVGPNFIYFEINGEIDRANLKFENESHLRSICQRIARRVGRRIDESAPMCDARLPDGSRVNIVVPPLAIDGTNLTIRKFQADRISFSGLIEKGALNDEVVALLSEFVKIRCNILVVGGTGSGKTTLLNCLNQGLSSRERIVTCEDAAELQLQQPHVVRLETRASNLEGTGEVPMRALIRNSLRMRPDRIIVGEIRGEEAFDFIQAMNTGHDGSMGTMHANSAADALSRLEGLISLGAPSLPSRTIQQMVHSAIDIIIEVRRFPDGRRRIAEVIEITSQTEQGVEFHPILCFSQPDDETGRASEGRFVRYPIESIRIRRKADRIKHRLHDPL